MEETLTPDVSVSSVKLKVKNNTYDFYCKRKIKKEADAIRDDLISNGFDALVRKSTIDWRTYFIVWWRKP